MNYTNEQLQKIVNLLNDYLEDEFDSYVTLEEIKAKPTEIGLCYSTVTDAEIEIQVYLNLVQNRIEWWYDGELFESETIQFASEEELIQWLERPFNLTWDNFYYTPDLLWDMSETELGEWIDNHNKED